MRSAALLVALVAISAGCARREASVTAASDRETSLVLRPGASDVRRTNEYDGTLSYVIDDPYPGSVVREQIGEALSRAGWQPSRENLLTFRDSSANTDWWTFTKGSLEVSQMVEGWRNASGDVLTIIYQYEVPAGTVKKSLKVTAVLTRAATVAKMRQGS